MKKFNLSYHCIHYEGKVSHYFRLDINEQGRDVVVNDITPKTLIKVFDEFIEFLKNYEKNNN